MGILSKVANTGSSTDWRTTKKVWVKVSSTLWKSATALYGKTVNGWVKMWPGNAPSVRPSDPINIRLGGYNGTVASSVELFCSTNVGTAGTFLKLWGNDGSFDGVTPITISNRRMLCSDNIDGQVERFSLSGNDTIDFATTTQATRDLAEGYYIFYQLKAENVDGILDAYSPAVKVIKRKPALVSYAILSESGGLLQGDSGFSPFDVVSLSAQVRYGWWIKPGGYLGGTPVLKWWKNSTGSTGGTLLKEINIETGYNYVAGSYDSSYTYNTNTSNVLTISSSYNVGSTPLQVGEYLVAELYLENSYTAHYASPASYWAATAVATVPPPTFLTATTDRDDGVDLTFGGSSAAVSYDIFWNTGDVAPTDTVTPDFSGKSSPFLDTTMGFGVTRWYWVRAVNSSGLKSTWYPAVNGVIGTRVNEIFYNVNWLGNGGSSFNQGSPWSFKKNGTVTVPSATRIGYTFLFWANTASGAYTYSTSNVGGTWSPPAQNITMYARWQENICTIPDVIGMTEINATNAVNTAGFLYEYTDYIDTTNASIVGTVAAIDPAVGSQPGCGTNITLTLYRLPPATAPSGLSVTLTPTGTQMAGTELTASVSTTAGSTPITYTIQIFKRTGADPTNANTQVASGTTSATHTITASEAAGTPDRFIAYATASNSAGTVTGYSSVVTSTPAVATVVAPSGGTATVSPTTGTAGTTTYTGSTSGWAGSTATYTYSWQYFSSSSFSYVEYTSGTSFSPPANINSLYPNYGWRLRVAATNTAGTAYADASVTISSPAAAIAPSGGEVTLTPSGTQQAGTQICANVTAMSGTATISYITNIRKATGSSPTGTATSVASGSGTGNSVCCHTITASEAAGTPDQFKAYTVGSNSAGDHTIGSNTVISTPAVVVFHAPYHEPTVFHAPYHEPAVFHAPYHAPTPSCGSPYSFNYPDANCGGDGGYAGIYNSCGVFVGCND